MSQNVAETLPIGPVQAYFEDVMLGSPKSQAQLRWSMETVQGGLEDSPVNAFSYRTKEIAEVDIVIADLKMDQLRYVYGQANDFDERTVIATGVYVSGSSTVMRFKEEIKFSGTSDGLISLAQAGFEAGTVKVFKTDFSNTPAGYVLSTDFSATGVGLYRIAAGGIADLETTIVMYNQSATCAIAFAGGKFSDLEGQLRLCHYLDTGKLLQFRASRAKRVGASDWAVQTAAEFGGIPMTFHILGAMDRAPGTQLFDWAKEA